MLGETFLPEVQSYLRVVIPKLKDNIGSRFQPAGSMLCMCFQRNRKIR